LPITKPSDRNICAVRRRSQTDGAWQPLADRTGELFRIHNQWLNIKAGAAGSVLFRICIRAKALMVLPRRNLLRYPLEEGQLITRILAVIFAAIFSRAR